MRAASPFVQNARCPHKARSARLSAIASAALALTPDRAGLVDHEAIGDAWERANGKVSIVGLLIDQLTS